MLADAAYEACTAHRLSLRAVKLVPQTGTSHHNGCGAIRMLTLSDSGMMVDRGPATDAGRLLNVVKL